VEEGNERGTPRGKGEPTIKTLGKVHLKETTKREDYER